MSRPMITRTGAPGLFMRPKGSGTGHLLALTRGELVYSVALSSEGRAIAAHRFNRVVVRCSRRKVHHRDAMDHIRETLIPPVSRFCPAIEVLRVRAVVHH